MKKIVFGLQLDNKVPPIGMGEDGINYFSGPQQFTISWKNVLALNHLMIIKWRYELTFTGNI